MTGKLLFRFLNSLHRIMSFDAPDVYAAWRFNIPGFTFALRVPFPPDPPVNMLLGFRYGVKPGIPVDLRHDVVAVVVQRDRKGLVERSRDGRLVALGLASRHCRRIVEDR